MSGGVLTEGVPVRFPQELAEAARRIADSEGMTLSAWIRREVDREISRRAGQCHACGQRIPGGGADPEAERRTAEWLEYERQRAELTNSVQERHPDDGTAPFCEGGC